MKKLNPVIITLLLMALVNWSVAQDVIVMRNGDEIKAKVTEVGQNEIKYHKYENITGPIYSVKKTEVFMIRYENGSKDVFKDEATPLVVNKEKPKADKPAFSDSRIRKAKTASTIGYIIAAPILGLGLASAGADSFDDGIALGAAATVIGAVGIPLVAGAGGRLRREARVEGSHGLRIVGWVSYGLALGDAVVLLAVAGEEIDASAATVPVAVLGALAAILMAVDVRQTASQAEALKTGSFIKRVKPIIRTAKNPFGTSIPTIGIRIRL